MVQAFAMMRWVANWMGIFAAVSPVCAQSGLRLEADVGGRFAPVVAVRANRVVCGDEHGEAARELDVPFRVVGEPRAAAEMFCMRASLEP